MHLAAIAMLAIKCSNIEGKEQGRPLPNDCFMLSLGLKKIDIL